MHYCSPGVYSQTYIPANIFYSGITDAAVTHILSYVLCFSRLHFWTLSEKKKIAVGISPSLTGSYNRHFKIHTDTNNNIN